MESEEMAKGRVVLEGLRGRKGDVRIPFLNRKMLKKQAGAGKARFRLLEFGDIDGRDVKAAGFDARAGAREGGWENDGVAEGEGVGSVWLGGIDVDPVVAREWGAVKPGAIGEERVAADVGDGRFEMQAAGGGHGDDFVLVRSEDGSELANAFGVAAPGEADKKLAADAKDISTFEGAGKSDVFERSKRRKRLGERSRFWAARLRA